MENISVISQKDYYAYSETNAVSRTGSGSSPASARSAAITAARNAASSMSLGSESYGSNNNGYVGLIINYAYSCTEAWGGEDESQTYYCTERCVKKRYRYTKAITFNTSSLQSGALKTALLSLTISSADSSNSKNYAIGVLLKGKTMSNFIDVGNSNLYDTIIYASITSAKTYSINIKDLLQYIIDNMGGENLTATIVIMPNGTNERDMTISNISISYDYECLVLPTPKLDKESPQTVAYKDRKIAFSLSWTIDMDGWDYNNLLDYYLIDIDGSQEKITDTSKNLLPSQNSGGLTTFKIKAVSKFDTTKYTKEEIASMDSSKFDSKWVTFKLNTNKIPANPTVSDFNGPIYSTDENGKISYSISAINNQNIYTITLNDEESQKISSISQLLKTTDDTIKIQGGPDNYGDYSLEVLTYSIQGFNFTKKYMLEANFDLNKDERKQYKDYMTVNEYSFNPIFYIQTEDSEKQEEKTYYTYSDATKTFTIFTGDSFEAGISYYEKVDQFQSNIQKMIDDKVINIDYEYKITLDKDDVETSYSVSQDGYLIKQGLSSGAKIKSYQCSSKIDNQIISVGNDASEKNEENNDYYLYTPFSFDETILTIYNDYDNQYINSNINQQLAYKRISVECDNNPYASLDCVYLVIDNVNTTSRIAEYTSVYRKTSDSTKVAKKIYYYKNGEEYIKYIGTDFEEGTIYYELTGCVNIDLTEFWKSDGLTFGNSFYINLEFTWIDDKVIINSADSKKLMKIINNYTQSGNAIIYSDRNTTSNATLYPFCDNKWYLRYQIANWAIGSTASTQTLADGINLNSENNNIYFQYNKTNHYLGKPTYEEDKAYLKYLSTNYDINFKDIDGYNLKDIFSYTTGSYNCSFYAIIDTVFKYGEKDSDSTYYYTINIDTIDISFINAPIISLTSIKVKGEDGNYYDLNKTTYELGYPLFQEEVVQFNYDIISYNLNRKITISPKYNGNFFTGISKIYEPKSFAYNKTKDSQKELNKDYYYILDNDYIIFTGDEFEEGVTYYEQQRYAEEISSFDITIDNDTLKSAYISQLATDSSGNNYTISGATNFQLYAYSEVGVGVFSTNIDKKNFRMCPNNNLDFGYKKATFTYTSSKLIYEKTSDLTKITGKIYYYKDGEEYIRYDSKDFEDGVTYYETKTMDIGNLSISGIWFTFPFDGVTLKTGISSSTISNVYLYYLDDEGNYIALQNSNGIIDIRNSIWNGEYTENSITDASISVTGVQFPINKSNIYFCLNTVTYNDLLSITYIDGSESKKVIPYIENKNLLYYSNSSLIFSKVPTVLYKKNQLAINTLSSKSDSVVYIGDINDTVTKITLEGINNGQVCTIDLETGEADGFTFDGGKWGTLGDREVMLYNYDDSNTSHMFTYVKNEDGTDGKEYIFLPTAKS